MHATLRTARLHDPLDRMWESLRRLLGARGRLDSEAALATLTERRLPIQVLDRLVASGLSPKEITAIVLPARTLAHRRAGDAPLTVEESDKALRLGRATALAEAVWGDRDRGLIWLRKPQKRLQGRAPLSLLTTSAGARLVEELLIQIDEGYFA
jgi:putative toxin-antitoxin system antitoxin component (TIGR02293 family)